MRQLLGMISLVAIALPIVPAQDRVTSVNGEGFHVYSLGVASTYSSLSLPQAQITDAYSIIGTAPISYSGDFSAVYSASVGWRQSSPTSTISVLYSPNFVTYRNNPEWNSFTHAIMIDADRPLRLNSRATLHFSFASNFDDFRQFSVLPSTLNSTLTNPDGFSSVFGVLNTSSTYSGTVSRGLNPTDAPAQILVYGNRVLTLSGTTSLQYDLSSRWHASVSLAGVRSQRLSGGDANQASTASLASQTTTGNITAETSYSLSRFTDAGVEVNVNRSFSSLEDAYGTAVNAFYNRQIGRHWFVRVNGGSGFYLPVSNVALYTPPSGAQMIAGTAFGYRNRGVSVLFTAQRTMTNSYAVGGNSTLFSVAASKSLRSSGWRAGTSLMHQQFQSGGSEALRTWQLTTNLTRPISPQLLFQLQYAFSTYRGDFGPSRYALNQSALRVGLQWSPGIPPR